MNFATPLLEVSGLIKRYGGLVAIDQVDLQLQRGTITGVIGPNGAGKTTLVGLIGGAVLPTQGSIRLDGRDISRLPASERARAGIGRTYQIPRPFLDMTVEENVEVAQYSIAPFISAALAREERDAVLARTGLAEAAQLPARALPLLRRKRLEVARALALKPRIVLLDEVGAGLVDSEVTELIALIRSVADPNKAIVIVEHVLRIVRECCTHSMVLNFGKKLIEGPTEEIFANDQVAAVYLGTGGDRASGPTAGSAPEAEAEASVHVAAPAAEWSVMSPLIARPAKGGSDTPLLELHGICASYGQARVLKGINLIVQEGEAVAVLGANGAGKTMLARTISGAIAPTSGVIRIAGNDVAGWPPHRIAQLGIAHCMEGRRIFPTLSVRENLLIAARKANTSACQERLECCLPAVPGSRGAQGPERHLDVGGPAADACDRPRADGAPPPHHFRRDQPWARAGHDGQALRGPRSPETGRHDAHCYRARR